MITLDMPALTQGKEAARRLLRQRLNLANIDVPIVSCVTRLVAQKVSWLDIYRHIFAALL
jgi:glycogen synthase